MNKGDYEVGYGRPPRRTRFKKGTSGNPAGRPRGRRPDVLIDLHKELSSRVQITEQGRRITITKGELLARALVAGAIKGDAKARRDLLDMINTLGGKEPPRPDNDNVEDNVAEDADLLAAYVRRKSGGGRHD
nr:DUF5681 domain-containing protein [Neoroseomonas eburnea]